MKSISLVLACFLAATSVNAQALDGQGVVGFDRIDADSDGTITRDEAARIRERLALLRQ